MAASRWFREGHRRIACILWSWVCNAKEPLVYNPMNMMDPNGLYLEEVGLEGTKSEADVGYRSNLDEIEEGLKGEWYKMMIILRCNCFFLWL